jgi:topoisomerase-4 subunit A
MNARAEYVEGGEQGAGLLNPASHVICASVGGRILTFEIAELKAMPGAGAA